MGAWDLERKGEKTGENHDTEADALIIQAASVRPYHNPCTPLTYLPRYVSLNDGGNANSGGNVNGGGRDLFYHCNLLASRIGGSPHGRGGNGVLGV